MKKIAIIGIGHMGSWLANELAKDSGNEVAVYDIDESKPRRITGGRVKIITDLNEIKSFEPQLLINAVSLRNTIQAFDSVINLLPKDCILADVASIKAGLPEFYKKAGMRFVSVHPMFGPTFANVEALSDENMVIIRESNPDGAAIFEALGKRLEINLFHYTFKEHDEMMAYSLTLPFAASLIFAACMEPKSVPGTTFKKHKTIAKGLLSEDDWLLSEILFSPHSLRQLEKVSGRIEFLKHIIKGRDYEEAKRFFEGLRRNIK